MRERLASTLGLGLVRREPGMSLDAHSPVLRQRSLLGPTADELDSVCDEIVQALEQVKPATAGRRLRLACRLTASLPSFSRYLHHNLWP